jgi:hypothetical protein
VTYKGVLEICTFHKKSRMAGFSFGMPDDGFLSAKLEAGKIRDEYLQKFAEFNFKFPALRNSSHACNF